MLRKIAKMSLYHNPLSRQSQRDNSYKTRDTQTITMEMELETSTYPCEQGDGGQLPETELNSTADDPQAMYELEDTTFNSDATMTFNSDATTTFNSEPTTMESSSITEETTLAESGPNAAADLNPETDLPSDADLNYRTKGNSDASLGMKPASSQCRNCDVQIPGILLFLALISMLLLFFCCMVACCCWLKSKRKGFCGVNGENMPLCDNECPGRASAPVSPRESFVSRQSEDVSRSSEHLLGDG